MDWGVIIAAGSLELVILTSAIGVVWKLSRVEVALRAESTEKYAALLAEFTEKHAALSAKTYQVEIWARDEFVRRGSFEAVIARMERGFGDLRTEIAQRLDKMADRIEHISGHQTRD